MSESYKKDFLYFHSSTCSFYQKKLSIYVKIMKERLFPFITDINVEAKKECCFKEELYSKHFTPDRDDQYSIYEKADEDEIAHGIDLCEVNGYISLLSIVGLYHLWERGVINFLIDEKSHFWLRDALKIDRFDDIEYNFESYGIEISKFDTYHSLNELRLVANTIKHGGGFSLDSLSELKKTILKKNSACDNRICTGAYTISGVDIFPTIEHIEKYGNAAVMFWDHAQWKSEGEYRYRIREAEKRDFKKEYLKQG